MSSPTGASSDFKMRSVEFKDSSSPSATRTTESKVASSFTCRRRPLPKRLLVRLELDRYCHWPRRRGETADKLGENESAKKNKKNYGPIDMSVSKLKLEVARSEYDARFAAADRNRVASIEYCVAHLFTHLDRGSKAWVTVNISFPRPFAWFLPFDFSLAVAIDDATSHAQSGAKKYRTRSRKKVSGRRFKTRSVGLVEAQTFFCLALYKVVYKSAVSKSSIALGRFILTFSTLWTIFLTLGTLVDHVNGHKVMPQIF